MLARAGVDRRKVYVTNAVKHFKFVPRGKRRLHQNPTSVEIKACRHWLEAELTQLKPSLVVALGGSAARALFGDDRKIGRDRGRLFEYGDMQGFITVHPSSLLRLPDQRRAAEETERFVTELREVARWAPASRAA
jgi:DNA polymerase